ncbi:flagellar basal-body rod protein FlgB [Thermanaeromonas toyohensis ToBE]|uniref:Flagellar basal body rod protein FlgB n=1 Tax=Thermanaeromonas toyohensis ToBE TaxID=698762 RepID=A0A1W1VLN3_9FIRM|nr:flagellar basal body rod protein FlgB [Thermanaeromonas toyohensis]SMB93961.1 flagellar basal-body rod protein FlgB [Thermanaeromonas toyohensis ToBE]
MFLSAVGEALRKVLEAAALRQRVIAHNLANANTPGFKRYYVTFEESLRRALRGEQGLTLYRTHPRHLPGSGPEVEPRVEQDRFTAMRRDGNNVDIEREMVELVMNSLNYNLAVQQLNGRLGMWRYVINEGRR